MKHIPHRQNPTVIANTCGAVSAKWKSVVSQIAFINCGNIMQKYAYHCEYFIKNHARICLNVQK